MTLSQLRTFIAVAEDGSVRAAAERLHVSQPSVSGSIAALSEEVGVALTERDGRGMKLSPAGEAFLPHAIEALGLLELGTRMAQSAASKVSATVRIAAVYTAAESLLPPLLRSFREAHSDIPIQLEIGNREFVLDLLASRNADIGIGGRPPEDGSLEGTIIARNEHIIVAAPDHHLAGAGKVSVRDLADETWLVREEASGTRRLVDEYLAAAHITPPVTTIGSNSAVAAAAMVGLGVGLVPLVSVEHQIASGQLVRLAADPPPPSRDWYALLPARRPSPVARVLADFLSAR
ncbi:MAG: LysR family transcriptional regulator [Thermoleophilia bacterium]|jgi:DNA-binding transcriptional LysR family regulator